MAVVKNPVILPFAHNLVSVDDNEVNDWLLPLPALPHAHNDGVTQLVWLW